MRLQQLIYCSQQLIRPEDLDDVLEAIIEASVRNNRAAGVTGLLLAHQGWFLQILEGPASAVQTTYGRIVNDCRHIDSDVISTTPISKRSFGEWSMCARRLTRADNAILDVLDERGAFDPTKFKFKPKNALRLLLTVRDIRDRVA